MMIKSKLTDRTVERSFQYFWYLRENDWTKSLFLSVRVLAVIYHVCSCHLVSLTTS